MNDQLSFFQVSYLFIIDSVDYLMLNIILDFDGTIFLQDTGHILFDNYGCGSEKRAELDESIGSTKSFREASEELWGSLNVTLREGLTCLQANLVLDRDFRSFFDFTVEHRVPFTVISAGIRPLLRGALLQFLGPQKSSRIGIISNDASISKDGTQWKPIWKHDCELGHDKARSIREWKQSLNGPKPLVVFIGDGVSDLAAASEADVLFARKGLKLERHCIDHKIPHIPYHSFQDITNELDALVRNNKHHILTRIRPTLMRTQSIGVPQINVMKSVPTYID
jgi:2,3-diketo-5-methylthio-1-phosphopentane phosphatase